MEPLFKPIKSSQLALFDDTPVSAPGRKKKGSKPQKNIVNVNHEKAKRRYYFIRRLREKYNYEISTSKLTMVVPYESFEAMPVGEERYYVVQLIKLGLQYQFKILHY